jgi:hypothetical protein
LKENSLPKVPDTRKTGRAAVNTLRALLERHDHIVHEVDGQNDFGEDLHLTFTANGQTTGDMIKIQIKGGRSWYTADGYGVPVGQHSYTWCDGNVPVICIVHDPETDGLYWANATRQLLSARREGKLLKTITVSREHILDDASISSFVSDIRSYLSRYRGNRAIQAQLGEMAGVEFGPSDIVMHYVNVYGEDLIFWQRRGEGYATLLHSDLDWKPEYVDPELLHLEKLPGLLPAPTVGDVILETAEALWLAACFGATGWARQPLPDGQSLETRLEVFDSYVTNRAQRRLQSDPDILSRSIDLLYTDFEADKASMAEIQELESDAMVRAEALSTPWNEMSPRAQRLTTLYLVKNVAIGATSLPINQQFRIIWRCERPGGEYGFSSRVGKPSTRLLPKRELVSARQLRAGDTIYWLSRFGNERGRRVSAVWDSDDTPHAVCVLFDQLSLGDTFWPGEQFSRKKCPR